MTQCIIEARVETGRGGNSSLFAWALTPPDF
jgi:hypothetical protein